MNRICNNQERARCGCWRCGAGSCCRGHKFVRMRRNWESLEGQQEWDGPLGRSSFSPCRRSPQGNPTPHCHRHSIRPRRRTDSSVAASGRRVLRTGSWPLGTITARWHCGACTCKCCLDVVLDRLIDRPSPRFICRDLECLEKGPVLSLEGAHGHIINAMDGVGGQRGALRCVQEDSECF